MIQNRLNELGINILTQAQYEKISDEGTVNENEIYMVPETEGPKIIISTITIPNTGWTDENGLKKITISNTSIKSKDVVDLNLDLVSLNIAENCGLKSLVESINNGFVLYAETIPSNEMNGTLMITKEV